MIFSNRRKALATVGAPNSSFVENRKFEAISYQAANSAEKDFGNFDAPRKSTRRAPKKSAKKGFSLGRFIEFEPKDKKLFFIIGAALIALILIVTLIVIIASSIDRNMTVENNAYAYFEKDGLYFLCEDGDIIGSGFENEINVVPALDKSFAYVIEETPEGKVLYLLEDGDLEQLLQIPVEDILALADYVPGVVYKDNGSVRFYSNDNDDRITKDPSADNFIIAPDASSVAYTQATTDKVDEIDLRVWANGFSQKYGSNIIPLELSKEGKYLYAYGVSVEDYTSKLLYAITIEDGTESKITAGFDSITAMNIDGDEIMFSTGTAESGYQTHIYELKKDKTHKVGAGICVPLMANENTVCLATFKKSVAENTFISTDPSVLSATYYIGSKYDSQSVAQYNGKLNSDGDIFYYKNSDGNLFYVELGNKNMTAQRIAEDVVDYVVTEKDNVYYVDDYDAETDSGYLTFYKFSTAERQRIHPDVTAIAFNKYSNIIYFTALDSSYASADEEDTYYVFQSKEGSGSEGTEFDRVRIAEIPHILDYAQKRTFVYIQSGDTGLYDLYYTSNGKSYKLVQSECESINPLGFELK